MNNRRVWSIAWRLSDGSWNSNRRLWYVDCFRAYSYLWEAGVRDIVLRRDGVNPRTGFLH